MVEQRVLRGEEVTAYTVEEFIRATRPDGLGHIYFNDEHIAAFEEVICDCCNAEIEQPEDNPEALAVFAIPCAAWCKRCFEEWLNGGEQTR
jgi:hypothetical protein